MLTVPRATPAIPGALPAVEPDRRCLGVILTALGLGIAIAATNQARGNWSAAVEINEDHALIRRGPYRGVCHPIYAGSLLALLGSATALGSLGHIFEALS